MQSVLHSIITEFPNLSGLWTGGEGEKRWFQQASGKRTCVSATHTNGACIHMLTHCSHKWRCVYTHVHLLTTSMAWFPKAQGLVVVCGPGFGEPYIIKLFPHWHRNGKIKKTKSHKLWTSWTVSLLFGWCVLLPCLSLYNHFYSNFLFPRKTLWGSSSHGLSQYRCYCHH